MTQPRRNIRLKEFLPLSDRLLEPVEAYMKQTNGTIGTGPYKLRTDEDSFILGPRVASEDDERFFVLGDSFVESSYVQEGARFCDVLTRLDENQKGRVFCNAGYSGSTSLNLLGLLASKIGKFPDSSVLYVLPSNDILSLINDDGFWNYNDKRYSPILPARPGNVEAGDFTQNLSQLTRVLQGLIGVASGYQLPFYMATCPFVQTDYEDLGWFRIRHGQVEKYEALMDKRRQANQILRRVARASRIPLIDLETILSDPAMFYDDVHLNEAGSAFVAEELMRYL